METIGLIKCINKDLETSFADDLDAATLKDKLVEYIEGLIHADFNHLVFLLYRIDVSEQKLKKILADTGGLDAANVIAGLIIERISEKIRSRAAYTTQRPKSDEELW